MGIEGEADGVPPLVALGDVKVESFVYIPPVGKMKGGSVSNTVGSTVSSSSLSMASSSSSSSSSSSTSSSSSSSSSVSSSETRHNNESSNNCNDDSDDVEMIGTGIGARAQAGAVRDDRGTFKLEEMKILFSPYD